MGLPLSSCPHLKAKDAGLATVGRRWPLPARLRRLRSALVTDCPIILAQCLPECPLCPESYLIAAGRRIDAKGARSGREQMQQYEAKII